MTVYIIALLLVFMILGSIIAVETRETLSAVISLAAVGVGLSIAFLFMGAPDLAITQVVVEVLCLIILIRATISRDVTTIAEGRPQFVMTIGVCGLLIFMLFGLHMIEMLPAFGLRSYTALAGNPTLHYLESALEETGAANVVAAILLDYRVYDTLGEVTVLFVSLIGVWAVLRKEGYVEEKVEKSEKRGDSDETG